MDNEMKQAVVDYIKDVSVRLRADIQNIGDRIETLERIANTIESTKEEEVDERNAK